MEKIAEFFVRGLKKKIMEEVARHKGVRHGCL
jgi:hypothetical protein